jgi:hypothetical protein
VGLRVFLLRKRSWRLVHIVLIVVETGWCADSRYWNRSPRTSSSSLSEEVVGRVICSRISWGRSLAVAEEQVMHLPVDASLLLGGMLLSLEMRHFIAARITSYHFIHIIWVYLDFIYNSSDYFDLTDYKLHLEIELESLEIGVGLEEVGSVILLALGCFLALFVQLGDLGRQLFI